MSHGTTPCCCTSRTIVVINGRIVNSDVLKTDVICLPMLSVLQYNSSSQYNLRKGAHDKELITKTSQLNERDFIIRMLYKNCY